MTMLDAWNACQHGKAILIPEGKRLEKWMGDKPGMRPSFERFLEKNSENFTAQEIMSGDWIVEA